MDAAFPSAPYASMTTDQLRAALPSVTGRVHAIMTDEIARRAKVAAGDRSVMYPGERLRAARREREAGQ